MADQDNNINQSVDSASPPSPTPTSLSANPATPPQAPAPPVVSPTTSPSHSDNSTPASDGTKGPNSAVPPPPATPVTPIPPPPPPKRGLFGRIFSRRQNGGFEGVSSIKKNNFPTSPVQPRPPMVGTDQAAPAASSPVPSVTPANPPSVSTATTPGPSVPPLPPPVSHTATAPKFPGAAPVGPAAIIKRPTGKIKIIIGVILVAALACVGIFFLFFYRAKINISPVGGADQILLDGQAVTAGLQKVNPGVHSILISKDGYITYRQTENFKINQTMNIDFPLIRATEPILVEKGASNVAPATTTRFIYYQLSDGRIASVTTDSATGQFKGYAITNNAYPDAKKILYSDDDSFAVIQDGQSVKAVNFTRTDALNQTEAILPIDATEAESITWNTGSSNYVTEPNSKFIYDLAGEGIWSLMESSSNFSKSDILMRLDATKFSDLVLDWSNSPKQVLIIGGAGGVLDIATRHWEQILTDKTLVWGQWGPQGKYGIILDDAGEAYVLKDYQLTKLNLITSPKLISWTADSKAIIISDGRPLEVNFDTNERINYAEINGLKTAGSAVVRKGRIFFADSQGVETAPLTENVYPMAQVK